MAGSVQMGIDIKAATVDRVNFYDVEANLGINIVAFSKLKFCPRVGEIVELPGEHSTGAGAYEVVSVHHTFVNDEENGLAPAKAFSVHIGVKRAGAARLERSAHYPATMEPPTRGPRT